MPGSSRAARGEPLDAEVIVVGGGVGGLCAAIAAAAHGFEVALFESAPELGGARARLPGSTPGCTAWATT